MPTNVTWNGVSYSIPLAGELNWASLSNFLIALGTSAAVAEEMRQAIRVATTSPVSVVAATDFGIITDLSVPGAVAVNLPAGVNGQIFAIVDGKGDALTNNITITPNGAETIGGAASIVLNKNRQSVLIQYHTATTDWKLLEYSIPIGGVTPSDFTGIVPASKGGTGVANNDAATMTRVGNFDLEVTTTAATTVTMPVTGTLSTLAGTESLSNKTLVLPKLDDAGTGDLVLASASTLTADHTLTFDVNDADRSLDLSGNLVLGASLTTTPANALTLTTTAATNVTLPTTGTLATLAGTEQLTNKDIDGGTASNTSRITLPKNTSANLAALTRKQGTVVYDTDTNLVNYDDGSTLIPLAANAITNLSIPVTQFALASGSQYEDVATTGALAAGLYSVGYYIVVDNSVGAGISAPFTLELVLDTVSGNSTSAANAGVNFLSRTVFVGTAASGYLAAALTATIESDGTDLTINGTTLTGNILYAKTYVGAVNGAGTLASGALSLIKLT